MFEPVPTIWLEEATTETKEKSASILASRECNTYSQLTKYWRKAMKWNYGLDKGLSVMLACATSTKMVGDPLWVKIISPPSSGKTSLAEALTVSRKYVVSKSTIRGFHTGWKSEEDNSLLAKLYDKTLIVKDGDTLLRSPNLSQILSEGRDIYDGSSRTHYRNKTEREYTGIRMTWILCGTSTLRQIDSSELGERFLDCVIMDKIDPELEDDINWRVVNRTDRNLSIESNGQASEQYDPAMVTAMERTGGYVDYLRDNANSLISSIYSPDKAKRRCIQLGTFVAYMRARPNNRLDEEYEREFSARLVSQLYRLAKCLAIVMNKSEVDKEILNRVSEVALDTARGTTLDITKTLYKYPEGMDIRGISLYTKCGEDRCRTLLKFLHRIGAIEFTSHKARKLGSYKSRATRYKLTERVRVLFYDSTT